ncbi:hypothetical protein VZT92_005877 [Zoarces viviparus]|uniref:Uncharacterized protein n=1 Tax=Zoarces viviparus TaxID=48416 RepID=A0AAW1FNS5_ZOAVI
MPLRDMWTRCQEQSHYGPEPVYPVSRMHTPEYCEPYTPPRRESLPSRPLPSHTKRLCPKPQIPAFTKGDLREFARLKVALENLLPLDATERFKYQILVDHLKYGEALLIADSYTNSLQPYTDTMASLIDHYGQPHQLALRKIADLMDFPNIARGDTCGFKQFTLRLRELVGMLDQLGDSGHTELHSNMDHKLPQDMRAEFKRFLYPMRVTIPSLLHFSDWLDYELKIQETVHRESLSREDKSKSGLRADNHHNRSTSILHTTDQSESSPAVPGCPVPPESYVSEV